MYDDVKVPLGPNKMPELNRRTDTIYAKTTLASLGDRGITDPFLNELAEVLKPGQWLAGGYIGSIFAGDKPKDADFFFNSASLMLDFIKVLTQAEDAGDSDSPPSRFKGWKLMTPREKISLEETRFVSLKKHGEPEIQLIKIRWYDSAEHVIDTFDFTAAQFALDGPNVVMSPLAPIDVVRKRLVLHRMTFPSSTIRRMIKYTQKGYYACPGSLQKIAEATGAAMQNGNAAANGIVYVD